MQKFPAHLRSKFRVFEKLNTPHKIQDFLDRLPVNFEKKCNTCRSPLYVLKHREAQCLEGAILAAAALWYHGERPLLLDLKTARNDDDHVVALFREHGHWGALSKTNHSVLRYRDAVYKNVRELALSYFNEYFLDSGIKTLRSYSAPLDLERTFEAEEWLTSPLDLWGISEELDAARHFPIAPLHRLKKLRPADRIEIKAGKIVEWKRR